MEFSCNSTSPPPGKKLFYVRLGYIWKWLATKGQVKACIGPQQVWTPSRGLGTKKLLYFLKTHICLNFQPRWYKKTYNRKNILISVFTLKLKLQNLKLAKFTLLKKTLLKCVYVSHLACCTRKHSSDKIQIIRNCKIICYYCQRTNIQIIR